VLVNVNISAKFTQGQGPKLESGKRPGKHRGVIGMAIKGVLLKHGNTGVICRQRDDGEPQEKGDRRREARRTLMPQIIKEHKGAFDELARY